MAHAQDLHPHARSSLACHTLNSNHTQSTFFLPLSQVFIKADLSKPSGASTSPILRCVKRRSPELLILQTLNRDKTRDDNPWNPVLTLLYTAERGDDVVLCFERLFDCDGLPLQTVSSMVRTFTHLIIIVRPRCILYYNLAVLGLHAYLSSMVLLLMHGITKTQPRCMLHHKVVKPGLHAYCSNMVRISMCRTRQIRHRNTYYWPCSATNRRMTTLLPYGSL